MRRLLLPLSTMLLLCIFLIYYQMGVAGKTVGTSRQSEQLLKESNVEWSIKGKKAFITLQDKEHNPITSLGEGDRKKLTILAVNEDFSFFRHVKPTYNGNGMYESNLPLKKGENYSFFLYMDDDEKAYPISTYRTSKWKKDGVSLQLDALLNKEVGGVEGALAFTTLFAQTPSKLTFSFQDDGGGKNKFNPIAKHKGVLYIVNQATTELLIAYPADNEHSENSASFYVTFPSEGIYKLWGEFQWNGKTKVFPYVVEVLKKE